jgi:hypothetical protein
MHLLAVADTLSHFSSDIMDKLAQANAGMSSSTIPDHNNRSNLNNYDFGDIILFVIVL